MIDPYRTLGLTPGASEAEIKRAYRRLAKEFHPDAAGEAAIPRFLAIQAAYETLVGPLGRGRFGRPGASPRREPWRADPDRARATRDAWRARARRGSGEAAGGTTAGDAGGRPPGGTRRARQAGGDGGPSTSARPSGPSGTGDRPRSRRRATPGSTSYDGADQGPFEPEWSGASWYGATSGTYWTLNPREYADPRKHGPEYQARARRASTGPDGTTDVGGARDEAPETETSAETGAPSFEPEAPGPEGPNPASAGSATAGSAAQSSPPSRTGDTAAVGVPPRAPAAGRRGARDSGAGAVVALLGAAERTRPGRLALALLGWPPIGLAMAALVGELTGCARFSASCEESFGLLTWVAQLAILAILLALPRIAAWATVGTLALLAAALPAVSVVGISGGARDLEEASALLIAILAVAWFVGVAVAALRLPADGADRPSPAS